MYNGAPGIDGIDSKVIKCTHLYLLKPLVYIFNLIFKTDVVPSYFKTSVVTPILKSGNRNEITNYRSISLISNFGKILEKALKTRLLNFLNAYDILSHKQFGFIEGVSTSNSMYESVTEITNNLNNNKKTIAVFLDLAKAFDTVPHDALLGILSRYGVRGPVLGVFNSYLSNRRQCVKINGARSDQRVIRMGVPQGTVLGPLLFIIYINMLLAEVETGGTILSYADDTVITFNADNWQDVRERAERGIKFAKGWFDSFGLSLNIKKTNYISFSITKKNRPNYDYLNIDEDDQYRVKEVTHTRYLGIIIDQNLKWHEHSTRVTQITKLLIHKFYVLREMCGVKLLLSLYRALFESILTYGILVWGGTYKNALHSLEIIQKSILKIIFKKHRLYPSHLLFSKNILNVRCLYILAVAKFMINYESKPLIKHNLGTRNRQYENLSLPMNKTTLNLKSILYFGPKIYNKVPISIRSSKIHKGSAFNKKCPEFIFNAYESAFAGMFCTL